MADTSKETIYMEVDDEITTVIDKVVASENRIIALVLPKRATTLQSVVNMKLLKRAADNVNKRVVLITSDPSLLPLAGIAGLHVAKTLQTKPAVPSMPDMESADTADVVAEEESADDEAESVDQEITEEDGSAATNARVGSVSVAEPETIDVDASEPESPKAAGKVKKAKIKIPNFEGFRLKLILGVLLIFAGIGGYVMGFVVLPKARIVVKTNTKSVTSTLNFTANSGIKDVDLEKSILPAEVKDTKKTDSQKISATGQKNVGEKAKGTAQFYNCSKDDKLSDTPRTVPAGTGISSGGLTFVTSEDVVVEPSSFSGNNCQSNKPSASVEVVAQGSGEQYNLAARSYAVAGFGTMTAVGSAMSGGTTRNVTVVSQQDLDNAKTQLADKSKDAAKAELVTSLKAAGLVPLEATLFAGDATIVSSTPKLGDEATDVAVTAERTFTMLGVKEDYLKQLIDKQAATQIDLVKQPLVDYGLAGATYTVVSKRSGTDQSLSFVNTATAGAKLDGEALKQESLGKKRSEVVRLIEAQPGVKEVEVQFSPAWIAKVPTKAEKVTVVFEEAQGTE